MLLDIKCFKDGPQFSRIRATGKEKLDQPFFAQTHSEQDSRMRQLQPQEKLNFIH